MKKFIYLIFTVALIGSFTSCTEDDLDPTLAQAKSVETSINTQEDLEGLLRGAFNRMTSSTYYGRDVIIFGEVRSDNCYANGNSGRFLTAAAMDLGSDQAYPTDTWTQIYATIAIANILIENENAEIEGEQDEINHVIGQAYAVRALAHFDLLRIYGQQHVTGGDQTLGIPYVKEFKGDDLSPARNSVAEVESFIYDDLTKAKSLMSESLNGSKEFVTTYAVSALESRFALYFGDWGRVIDAAEDVIGGPFSIVPASDYAASFYLDEPVNSIFELAFSSTDNANINGLSQIYRGAAYGDVRALDDLLTIFDAGDVRAAADMIGYDPDAPSYLTNLGKFPSPDYSDNVQIIRYEEVLLNYAEALWRAGQTGVTGSALATLNLIPAERGALAYGAINEDNILQERRRELCFEGFRFDDLARTGRDIPLVDATSQAHEGPAYGTYNYAFPIPKAEMNANANMVQNFNYN
ncbi:MAG: RagB/SusD family nutrient uptake outer membrane protein [Bacteroidales bacterium]